MNNHDSKHDYEGQARAAFDRGQERHHQIHGPAMISECRDPVCEALFLATGWRYPEQITETGDPVPQDQELPAGGRTLTSPAGEQQSRGGSTGDDDVIAWAVAACWPGGETVPLGSAADILAVIAAAQAAAAARGDHDHILACLQAWAVSSGGGAPGDLLITVELSRGLRITGDILPAGAVLSRLPPASTVETRDLLSAPRPVTYPPQVACSAVLTAVLDNARAAIARAWPQSGLSTWPAAAAMPFARGARPVRSQVTALVGAQRAAEWEAAVLDGSIDPDGILTLMLEAFQQGTAAQGRNQRRRRQARSTMEQHLAGIRAGVAGAESALADIAAEAEGT